MLRQLLEREHALTARLARIDYDIDHARRQLANAEQRRPRMVRSIAEAEWRIDNAHQRVTALDRPLRRRHNRHEIDSWRRTIANSRADVERHRAELAELDAAVPKLRQELAAANAFAVCERPTLERDRDGIRRRLDIDRGVRADRLAVETPCWLVDYLGARPLSGSASALWDDAVARVEQHRMAFDITDTHNRLGRNARWDDGAYEASRGAAAKACDRLGHDLGRDLGVELPGMGLSRGL